MNKFEDYFLLILFYERKRKKKDLQQNKHSTKRSQQKYKLILLSFEILAKIYFCVCELIY